jgi:hypothetical protein
LYRTASRSEHGEPFVRIAAGTEHLGAARDVAAVLAGVAGSLR